MKRTVVALASVGALCLIAMFAVAGAAGTVESISGPAAVLAPAQRIGSPTDVVTIFNKANAVSAIVQSKAAAAAAAVRAGMALGRGATVGLRTVQRGTTVVKAAPTDFQFPLSATALPIYAVGPLMGSAVAAVLGSGQVVMGARSAALNLAQVGDVIELVADDATTRRYTIGMVADDAVVGGTELVLSTEMADQLGVVIDTRIVLWGFSSRYELEAALVAQGLTTRSDTRIRRSWDLIDPDGTLSLVSTKQLLGEFAYKVAPDDTVTLTSTWINAYLPAGRELLNAEIAISARCNLRIRADLIAALAEVAQRGLASAIDVDNANTYGGCFNPRFNRLSAALGSLSRHAWAGALDTNTVTNAQGAIPQMNCDVVRILRKHNFAWGGNFLTPDGMHFEWVGSRRDELQYPSKYCPNVVVAPGTERLPADPTFVTSVGLGTLLAEDGWDGE